MESSRANISNATSKFRSKRDVFLAKIKYLKQLNHVDEKTINTVYSGLHYFLDLLDEHFDKFSDIVLEWMNMILCIKNKCISHEEKQKFDDTIPNLTQYFSAIIINECASPTFKECFFKLWNNIISQTSTEIRKDIVMKNISAMQELTESIFNTGHYVGQMLGFEIFSKYVVHCGKDTEKALQQILSSQEFSTLRDILIAFDYNNFDGECRKVLNHFNMEISKNVPVYSIKAESVLCGPYCIKKPMHRGNENDFWIDFNSATRSVSFFCDSQSFSDATTSCWLSLEAKVHFISFNKAASQLIIKTKGSIEAKWDKTPEHLSTVRDIIINMQQSTAIKLLNSGVIEYMNTEEKPSILTTNQMWNSMNTSMNISLNTSAYTNHSTLGFGRPHVNKPVEFLNNTKSVLKRKRSSASVRAWATNKQTCSEEESDNDTVTEGTPKRNSSSLLKTNNKENYDVVNDVDTIATTDVDQNSRPQSSYFVEDSDVGSCNLVKTVETDELRTEIANSNHQNQVNNITAETNGNNVTQKSVYNLRKLKDKAKPEEYIFERPKRVYKRRKVVSEINLNAVTGVLGKKNATTSNCRRSHTQETVESNKENISPINSQYDRVSSNKRKLYSHEQHLVLSQTSKDTQIQRTNYLQQRRKNQDKTLKLVNLVKPLGSQWRDNISYDGRNEESGNSLMFPLFENDSHLKHTVEEYVDNHGYIGIKSLLKDDIRIHRFSEKEREIINFNVSKINSIVEKTTKKFFKTSKPREIFPDIYDRRNALADCVTNKEKKPKRNTVPRKKSVLPKKTEQRRKRNISYQHNRTTVVEDTATEISVVVECKSTTTKYENKKGNKLQSQKAKDKSVLIIHELQENNRPTNFKTPSVHAIEDINPIVAEKIPPTEQQQDNVSSICLSCNAVNTNIRQKTDNILSVESEKRITDMEPIDLTETPSVCTVDEHQIFDSKDVNAESEYISISYPEAETYIITQNNTSKNKINEKLEIICQEELKNVTTEANTTKNWILERYFNNLCNEPQTHSVHNIDSNRIDNKSETDDDNNTSCIQPIITDSEINTNSEDNTINTVCKRKEANLSTTTYIKMESVKTNNSTKEMSTTQQSITSKRKRNNFESNLAVVAFSPKKLRHSNDISNTSIDKEFTEDAFVSNLFDEYRQTMDDQYKNTLNNFLQKCSLNEVATEVKNVFEPYLNLYDENIKKSNESLKKINKLTNELNAEKEKFIEYSKLSNKSASKMFTKISKIAEKYKNDEKHAKDYFAVERKKFIDTGKATLRSMWQGYIHNAAEKLYQNITKHSSFNF